MVVDAWDHVAGNAARRRLGVCSIGYGYIDSSGSLTLQDELADLVLDARVGVTRQARAYRAHDPEITKLCEGIVSSQQAEIDQMRAMLRRTRSAWSVRLGTCNEYATH